MDTSDPWQGPGSTPAPDGPASTPGPAAPTPPPGAPPFAPPPFAPPGSSATPPPPPPPPTPPASSLWPPPPEPVAYGATPYLSPYGPPPRPVRPVSTALSAWLQVLFWVVAGASALGAVVVIGARSAFEQFMSGPPSADRYQRWLDADNGLTGVAGLYTLAAVALAVVMIIWTWRCHRAADSLQPGPRKYSSGWAIGAWFVPVASLVLPKLVIDETERISVAPRSQGRAVDWKAARTSPIGWVWWGLFVVVALLRVRSGLTHIDLSVDPDQSVISGYYLNLVAAYGLGAVSAACGALFVRKASRPLTPAGLSVTNTGGATSAGTAARPAPTSWAPTAPEPAWTPLPATPWSQPVEGQMARCEICRTILGAHTARCPVCGKQRHVSPPPAPVAPAPGAAATADRPPAAAGAPAPPPPPGPFAHRVGTPAGAPPPPARKASPVLVVMVSLMVVALVCVVAVTFLGRTSSSDTATRTGSSSGGYSDTMEQVFVAGCTQSGGSPSQCQCALDTVESMYDAKELQDLSDRYQRTGNLPSELTSAIQRRCVSNGA